MASTTPGAYNYVVTVRSAPWSVLLSFTRPMALFFSFLPNLMFAGVPTRLWVHPSPRRRGGRLIPTQNNS
jgi:hypothetical protein